MSKQAPPWTRIFIEIALRALRKIHLDYQLWSMQQDWTTEPNFRDLNTGRGIEYAEEAAVCSAIISEFVHSQYTSGIWIEENRKIDVEANFRYYRIAREMPYPNSTKRADIYIERVDPQQGAKIGKPSYVEAKRAYVWTTKLGDQKPQPPSCQLGDVIDDIKKLREGLRGYESSTRKYLLVWNVAEIDKTDGFPKLFLDKLAEPHATLRQVRWAPLSWDDYDVEKGCRNSTLLSVKRAIWVMMVEIDSDGFCPTTA